MTTQVIDVYPFVISTGGRDLTRHRCSLSTKFLPPVEMTVPPEQLQKTIPQILYVDFIITARKHCAENYKTVRYDGDRGNLGFDSRILRNSAWRVIFCSSFLASKFRRSTGSVLEARTLNHQSL